ncbi:MAG: LuxR C-terminal-related transcriptional regulator [Bacteroidota bacterium]
MNSGNTIRIIIADSQFLIVESLRNILGSAEKYAVCGIAGTKQELLALLQHAGQAVLIIDPQQLDLNGCDDLISIKTDFPVISVLVLTQSVSKYEFIELRKAGINNIVFKTTGKEELFEAIEATNKGKKYFTSDLLDLITDNREAPKIEEDSKTLTYSEMEIVRMIANGYTTKEIALQRNISFHTVNTHRKNIFRKLGVNNASELIIQAIRSGWIDNIEYYI